MEELSIIPEGRRQRLLRVTEFIIGMFTFTTDDLSVKPVRREVMRNASPDNEILGQKEETDGHK
jgi:hypothetical protein